MNYNRWVRHFCLTSVRNRQEQAGRLFYRKKVITLEGFLFMMTIPVFLSLNKAEKPG
jgi:hypothetical protein